MAWISPGDVPILNYNDLVRRLAQRTPPVRLIAVTKSQSPEKIRALHAQGQRDFGENYCDELQRKAEALRDLDLNWIYIGQLQSNKIQRLVALCSEIQSVASERHGRFVARYAAELKKAPYPIFIEVNLEEEGTKGGLALSAAEAFAKELAETHPELDIQGLMAIPPARFSDEACNGTVPQIYKDLAATAAKVGRGRLSLGMSADLEIALAAGTHCVRIGRALFGERS